ncbi:MAG: lysophospholipid acyltransferase family protein [Dehalococcoidia bacterium]
MLLPLALRLGPKVVAVEVAEEELRGLRELKGQRVVLTPSHSGGLEPFVLYHLSEAIGEEFAYLATKEIFERPLAGWFAQRLGAYSIVRGTPDRSSFRMTRQLLVEGRRWLVIFPEGHTCWQNDTVMPFQQGVVQLAFWAYEDMVKQAERPPLYFVPMAIKYIHLRDMRGAIDRSMRRLERRLLLASPAQPQNLYERLRRVGETVLAANEKKYNVRPGGGASVNERIQNLKELVVSRVATALGIPSRPEQSPLERIRYLFNTIDQIVLTEPDGPAYERQLHRRRQQEVGVLYEDLWQVLRFIALYDGYVGETLTSERFLDVLGLLELEVFRRRQLWGPRKALVKIGAPLDLGQYFRCYQTDKAGTLQEVTTTLESSVREMLGELSRQARAIDREVSGSVLPL